MSGQLVGQVVQHGPTDHNAWSVLTVIAEDLRGPDRHCALTNTVIATRARLSVRSVQNALKQLEGDGWIARFAGNGRGRVTTYRLLMSRFPSTDAAAPGGAVESPSEPVDNSDPTPEKGAPPAPFMAERVHQVPIKGAPGADTSVSVQDSVPPTPHHEDQLPGLLAAVGRRRTDGLRRTKNQQTGDPEVAAAVVLADVPEQAQPRDRVGLGRVVAAGLERGWTPEGIRAALAEQQHSYSRIGGGATLRAIEAICNRQPPSRHRRKPAWCGHCDERTRMAESEYDGRPSLKRCPDCHPLTQQPEIWQEATTA